MADSPKAPESHRRPVVHVVDRGRALDAASERAKSFRDQLSRVSDVVRQYAFAGIAVVWLFRSESPSGLPAMDQKLVLALLFLVVTLFVDLLHSLQIAVLDKAVYDYQIAAALARDEAPGWFPALLLTGKPDRALLTIKLLTLLAGFVVLLVAVASRITLS